MFKAISRHRYAVMAAILLVLMTASWSALLVQDDSAAQSVTVEYLEPGEEMPELSDTLSGDPYAG